jgi:hypothetical protein
MPIYNNNDEKSYASSGVGTAALTTGIIGTTLASGILNNGLGGILGGNQNPTATASYQLSQKDTRIAQLEAERYADSKFFALSERISGVESKIVAIETAAPLRDKILSDSILNLQQQMAEISVRRVPNYALSPGYGPAFVAPMPPPPFPAALPTTGGTTTTPTAASAAA